MRGLQTLTTVLSQGLLLLAAAAVIGVAVALLVARSQGQHILSVQTASMLPIMRPGDAVIVQTVLPRQLRVGDIISYESPRQVGFIITHRLVHIDQTTGWLTTQGDALKTPDPTFPPRLVVGQVRDVAPKLGTALNALRRPLGLVIIIYLPAGAIVILEAKRLSRNYQPAGYRLRAKAS